MQTVQFQCGNCGGMMGVGQEFLGQQVRCPSCQQVVVAPAASAPESASGADGNADDLFLANLETAPIGDPPKTEPQPEPTPTATSTEAPPTSEPAPPTEPASEAIVPGQASHGVVSDPAAHGTVAADTATQDASLPWNDPAARSAGPEEPVARAQRQAGGGISWLWLLPLLSYSILTTVVLVIVYNSLQTSNDTIRKLDRRIEDMKTELDDLRKARGKPSD
jgi:hypothetical protein